MKSYDCTVLITAYQAAETIEACVRSIFAQLVDGYQALILVGYDKSQDSTFKKLVQLADECPSWAEFRILINSEPTIIIDDQRTGRSNFLNCYMHAKGKAVLFCDGDDSWVDKDKLSSQLKIIELTGKASYTPPDDQYLKTRLNPFLNGNHVLFSSLCIPNGLLLGNQAKNVRLLDWYIVCLCHQGPGLKRTNHKVLYSPKKPGFWSVLSKQQRIKSTLTTAFHMISMGNISLMYKFYLLIYMTKLKILLITKF